MPLLGNMALLASAYQPRHGQGAPFVDHMEHQSDTPTSHDAPIDHQDQGLQRQMRQQDFGEGHKIDLRSDVVVLQPSGKAFHPALGLSTIRYTRGNFGQLRALAAYDPTDERRKRGQMPDDT